MPSDVEGAIAPAVSALEALGWQVEVSAPDGARPDDTTAVGNLAAGVAHNFNNLLSVILGHSDLILAEISPADPLFPGLEQIRTAGQAAAELTRQLLAMTGQQFLHPRAIDLNQLMAGVEPVLRNMAGAHLHFRASVAQTPLLVHVDPAQIEQAIMNLVINAREAMPDGGEVSLEVREVLVTEPRPGVSATIAPGRYAVVTVADTGKGMSPDVLARIFEPYFTTKAHGRENGLGLSIAHGIVEQSGGQFVVESSPGHGARFSIYLPLADNTAAAPEPRAPRTVSDDHGTETILLAEDDDRVRAVLRAMLRKQGYGVLEAANAGEAMLIFERRAKQIDLLLTDVVMPRLSGRKLVERLYAMRPDLKVIYMSGYNDDFVFSQGVLEPGAAFLPKPIRPEMLAQKVREVLDAPPVRRDGV
ncbi:MAG: ATP-binding protein [Pseudomonadota bacterium]